MNWPNTLAFSRLTRNEGESQISDTDIIRSLDLKRAVVRFASSGASSTAVRFDECLNILDGDK